MGRKIGSFQCEDYRLDKPQRQNEVIGSSAQEQRIPKYKPKKNQFFLTPQKSSQTETARLDFLFKN